MTEVLTEARSIRIKGRSFLAVVLSPELPIEQWLAQLDDLAGRSAGFFLERPVVLDVTDLKVDKQQLKSLVEELLARNVRVMGVEGARPSMLGAGMPLAMKGGKAASDFEVSVKEKQAETSEPEQVAEVAIAAPVMPEIRQATPSIIIREPIRSGQSVIFAEGDVTVLGSVASGAEVIAGGSVHIYGALRGRALAGSVGNSSARIFCRKLEAELLAIDGIYTTADQLAPELQGKSVQLWLEGDAIRAEKII
jgi:septum site-determining protein MinC